MDPKLEKIQKLIALALHNPNGEEARSAALKALELMQACGAIVSLPSVPAQPRQSPPAPSRDQRWDYLDLLRRQPVTDQRWYENLGWDFSK